MGYARPMKRTLALLAILAPLAAKAEAPKPLGPNNGQYGDWTAATYGTGKTKICYAFTKPQSTKPPLAKRGLAMLTVTERSATHDGEVSLTPGYSYPAHATVSLEVGHAKLPFYVQDNVAFTSSVKQAVAGFTQYATAATESTGPDGKRLVDIFSLNGFSAAYKAITAACP